MPACKGRSSTVASVKSLKVEHGPPAPTPTCQEAYPQIYLVWGGGAVHG